MGRCPDFCVITAIAGRSRSNAFLSIVLLGGSVNGNFLLAVAASQPAVNNKHGVPAPRRNKPAAARTVHKRQNMPPLNRELTDPYALPLATWPSRELLAQQTHWIRNTLDPLVAHSGGEALSVNDVLTLDAFLRKLHLASHVSLADLRFSRIHLAIVEICGKATRWPEKLIERAEAVQGGWEERFGPLRKVGWELGERLQGWEGCEGLRREEVLAKWVRDGGVPLSLARSRRWGDLGFRAGEWVPPVG